LQLTALFEQGRLTVDARPFALDDVADAHREGQTGHVTGKIVLVPEPATGGRDQPGCPSPCASVTRV
jgi:hypothetical protein